MAHDVFISYAHENKVMADALCATLERNGLRCWIAPRDVPPGNWGGAIVEAIEASRVFVLVFSSESNKSQQVLREVERAVSVGLTVVPVRLQDVTPSKDIAYFIGSVHWLDAMTPPVERQMEEVAHKLKIMLGAATTPRPRTTAAPQRKFSPAMIAGVAIVLCILAGVLVWKFRQPPKHSEPSVASEPLPAPAPVVNGNSVNALTVKLSGAEAEQGGNAQLQADVKGRAPITFIWQGEDSSGTWSTLKTTAEPILKFNTLGLGDDRHYRVIATNAAGAATSAPARLAVTALEPPVISRPPENVLCKVGQPAEFRAEVRGGGIMTYQWQSQKASPEWKFIAGATETTLSFPKVLLDDGGYYRLVVVNLAGAATSAPGRLMVTAVRGAKFNRHPSSITVSPGDRAVLEASVEGDDVTGPTWEFQPKGDSTWRPVPGVSGFTLTLLSVTPEAEGAYRCTVKSPNGPVSSQSANVTLVAVKPALDIFCQNSAQPNLTFVGDQILSAVTNSIASGGMFRLKNPPQKFTGRPRSAADFLCTLKFKVNTDCKRGMDRTGARAQLYYTPTVTIDVLWQIDRADGERVAGDHIVINRAGDRFTTAQNESARAIAEAKGLYPSREAMDEAKSKLLDQMAAVKVTP